MQSTATDMSHFMLAHLQGGRYGGAQILKLETVALMHRQQFTYDPRLPGVAVTFHEGSVNGYRTLDGSLLPGPGP